MTCLSVKIGVEGIHWNTEWESKDTALICINISKSYTHCSIKIRSTATVAWQVHILTTILQVTVEASSDGKNTRTSHDVDCYFSTIQAELNLPFLRKTLFFKFWFELASFLEIYCQRLSTANLDEFIRCWYESMNVQNAIFLNIAVWTLISSKINRICKQALIEDTYYVKLLQKRSSWYISFNYFGKREVVTAWKLSLCTILVRKTICFSFGTF